MLRLPTNLLQPGMTLAKPIIDEHGTILLRQGVELSGDYILNLERRGFASVYISDGDTNDIIVEDMLSHEVRRNAQGTLSRIFDFVRQVSSDFVKADSNTVVEALRGRQVVSALRGHDGFKRLEDSVKSVLEEIIDTDVLTGISQIRSQDDTVFSHSVDMTVVALMIGKRLHLNREDLKRLGTGCMLHDIGKIFFNQSNEHQNGTISLIELQKLREHPRLGYELLRVRYPGAVMTNHVALEHHERQDGSGYPRGLHGTNRIECSRSDRQNILLIAEIAAVADVYDILSMNRLGTQALTPKQIADTMWRLSGTFLNREVIDLFLSMVPILPTGMDVIVRTGRYVGYRGVVARVNLEQPKRPLVRLLYNPQQERTVPIDLDLARNPDITVEAILPQ